MIETLLVILLGFQPFYGDTETPAARKDRLTIMAKAIGRAVAGANCHDDDEPGCLPVVTETEALPLAAALVTQAFWESGLARHVHEGKCRKGECDGGRARSPWQFQPVPPVFHVSIRELWWKYKGADQDSTDDAAWAAALILARAHDNCGTWEGAIAQYATGSRCKWSGTERRMVTFRRVLAKLEGDADGGEGDED